MKVLKYLLFFIIFLFLSCSEDENVLNKEEGQLNAPTSYYVSAETALTNATAMLNKIEKASSKATRASEKSSREVEEIEVLHSNILCRILKRYLNENCNTTAFCCVGNVVNEL